MKAYIRDDVVSQMEGGVLVKGLDDIVRLHSMVYILVQVEPFYIESLRCFNYLCIFSMTETRVLKISQDAFKGTKRTSRKFTKPQKGGYDDAPPPGISTASLPAQPPLIAVTSAAASLATTTPTPHAGGTRKPLQLIPKKEKLTLVKSKRSLDKKGHSQTRKVVRIQMGNLRKSLRRAKDIVSQSKEKPIEEIEEILTTAGIIRKRTSETPMSEGKKNTLRGIYRDYLQLRLNAL